MPLNKQVPSDSPMITKANDFMKHSKAIKAIESQVAPIKKELAEHFKEALLKDIPKVKAEVPSVFTLCTTTTETMTDGTVVTTPTGENVQVQAKVVRSAVTAEDADKLFKAIGQEHYDTLIKEELTLKSAPLMPALQFALEHPEFCAISTCGTDSAVITIKGIDKLPGVTTEVSLVPVEGFLDAVRELPADIRKGALDFIKAVLSKGLQMAVAAGNKSASTSSTGGK